MRSRPKLFFSPKTEKVGTSISSYKQVIEVVKAGNAQGWGKFVEPVIKEDKFGLGFTPESQKNEAGTFSSGGLVSPHIINAADEDKADSDCDLDSWIRLLCPRRKARQLVVWKSRPGYSTERVIFIVFLFTCIIKSYTLPKV